MPASIAAFSDGATASLSSAEMMIAFTPCVVRSVMNGIWRSAFARFGPTWVTVPPSSPAALSMPVFAAAEYWLTMSFGREPTLTPPLAGRPPLPPPPAAALPEGDAPAEAGAGADAEAGADDAGAADDAAADGEAD